MKRGACLLGALLCVGCFKPAEERAERDEEVGRASGSGLEVMVGDGLAAVRSIDAAKVHLWENAPALDVRLESDAVPRTLELSVENCMPNAVLTTVSGQVSITAGPRARPTACTFSLELSSAVSELRLADPVTDQTGTFHFGVLSDIQEAIDDVQDVFSRINQQPNLSFVIAAGDLTERGTVEELERFQAEQKTLNVPYYVTLGNHELGESPPPYHDFYGRGSSSYVFRGVRFTFLDSASATLDSRVYDWLDTWLSDGKSGVHVIAMHIPPFDPTGTRNGAFASRNEAAKFLNLLSEGDVDLTIYGHIHSYYRFFNAGIEAHISGGGGAIPEKFDGIGRHFLDVTASSSGIGGVEVVRVD